MSLQNNANLSVSDPDVFQGPVVKNSSGQVVLLATLGNYANDTAAQAGGVPVGGLYRNASVLMIRVA